MRETYKDKSKSDIWDDDDVYKGLIFYPIDEGAGVMAG